MSRAWIAFYMGDYQKDTNRLTTLEHGAYFLLLQECWTHGNIPMEPADRAAIAKMSLREWLKIAPKVNAYFNDDGTNNRATREIEKAEVIRTKRAIAGQRGGIKSGISKAIATGRRSKFEANAYQTTEQTSQQTGQQKDCPAEAINNNNIKTTTACVERRPANGLGLSEEALAVMARGRR